LSEPGDSPDAAARRAILAPAAASLVPGVSEIEPTSFGRYEVVASIGKGGMGEIYLARMRGAGRAGGKLFALKVLIQEAGEDEELLAMFMDEASIMAQIHDPNVLEVFDFGRERDLYFLAMEYLEGRPLVRVMIDGYQKGPGLDYRLIATIGADAARGLYAAHIATGRNGQPLSVVHRDVSPQNIFVLYSGASKVIDFGVARATERLSHTQAGQLKGKAAYMSPEQVNGDPVDARSDVFSLGVCLWEMSAGRRLFRRGNDWETMSAVLQGPIVAPTRLRGVEDPALDVIILGALDRDPKKRTPSAGALEEQLAAYLARAPSMDDPVAVLMKQLYGQEAEAERELIRQLEDRAATDDEQDFLRRLSGISPLPSEQLRNMTLVSRADELSALDAFGESDPSLDGRTDPTVAIPPNVLDALRGQAMTEHTPMPSPFSEKTNPPATLEEPGSTPPPSPVPRLPSGPAEDLTPEPRSLPPPTEDRGEAVQRAVDALSKQQGFVRRTDSAARSVLLLPPPRKRARALWTVLAAALTVLAAGIWWMALRDNVPLDEPQEQVAKREAARTPTTAQILRLDTVVVSADVDTATATPQRSPAQLLSMLSQRGLAVVQSGARLLIDDGSGVVAISVDARLIELGRPGQGAGWLALSRVSGLPAVVWIGSLHEDAWRARSLSINDCPATAADEPSGISLAYSQHKVLLPPGGGALDDVALEIPSFATRAEIDPLGLRFLSPSAGAADPSPSCREGWAGDRLVVRRLPPGRYTVRFVGAGRTEETGVVVRPGVPAEIHKKKPDPRVGH
jgi:serine/threonine-protein kinase